MSNKDSNITGYSLSRNWFNFSHENTLKVRPIHTAVYTWAIEKCNRLGWKQHFGFPTSEAMEVLGIRNKNTYLKALNDLVDWGFIEMVEESKNQWTSCIIAISKNDTAHGTALDTALIQHDTQQSNGTGYGIGSSTDTIYKPLNHETSKPKTTPLLKRKIVDVLEEGGLPESPSTEEEKYILLALHIWQDVNSLQPNNQTTLNAKLGNWSEPIRLMVEQQDRTLGEIWDIWKRVQNDDFWITVILSTSKLREKFDDLQIKLKNTKAKGKNIESIVEDLY